MNRDLWSGLSVGCAVLAGICVAAFQSQGGGEAIQAAPGQFDLAQLANLLGMLVGGGGAVLGFIKARNPEAAPALDSLAQRLQAGKPVDGPYIATMVALQGLRAYFAGVQEATPHLDALAELAWQVDSQQATKPPQPDARNQFPRRTTQ